METKGSCPGLGDTTQEDNHEDSDLARNSIAVFAFALAGALAPRGECADRCGTDIQSGRPLGLRRKIRHRLADVTYQETREVTAVGSGGIKIKVTGKTAAGPILPNR